MTTFVVHAIPMTLREPQQPPPRPDDFCVELTIATALIRRGAYPVAHFYPILLDHSRRCNGQHTYTSAELAAVGTAYGLSKDHVLNLIAPMIDLGLLQARVNDQYRRLRVTQVQESLGLGDDFAAVWLPRTAYPTTATAYVALIQEIIDSGAVSVPPKGAIAS